MDQPSNVPLLRLPLLLSVLLLSLSSASQSALTISN
jgi:hypothetical protein